MDCDRTGKLILSLRKEKDMTQKQLANAMNISDKTISKWERGLGCPDVCLLSELSEILGVNIEKILLGDLEPNDVDGGNMKKIKFYACPTCGNILTATADETHQLNVDVTEDDFYITFNHEMTKNHYLSFVAYVNFDKVLLVKLYPEQSGEVRFPKMNFGKLYFYCNQHGLWVNK